jgi:predicted metal-dependent hydrolase
MTRRFNGSGVVCLDGREIEYEVVRSTRSKRVRLVIQGRPVVQIVAPERYRLGSIHDLLYPLRQWIFKHLDAYEQPLAKAPSHGDTLPFLGDDLRLVFEPASRATTRRDGNNLILSAPGFDPLWVLAALEAWLREQARQELRKRVELWSRAMGVQPGRITIRDQQTRWGSCSTAGNLNFSWRLVMAPLPVLEYVVIHELAHLREHNHSPAFWATVEEHCPQYVEHKRWLREEGPRLGEYLRG